MVDYTMNLMSEPQDKDERREQSTILRALRVPKNYSRTELELRGFVVGCVQ